MLTRTRKLVRKHSCRLRLGDSYWSDTLLSHGIDPRQYAMTAKSGCLWVGRWGLTLEKGRHEFLLRGHQDLTRLVDEAHAQLATSETASLTCTIDGVRMSLRTSEEIQILREIYVEGEYNIAADDEAVFLDVGMNVAMTTLYFAKRYPSAHIISFEPFAETYSRAIENIGLNTALADRISPRNYGLSDRCYTAEVEFDPQFPGSVGLFGLPNHLSTSGRKQTKAIEVRDAANVLDEITTQYPNRPVIMKIDCEGAEYAIIERLKEAQRLSAVSAFLVEFHQRAPGQSPERLKGMFRKCGFYCIHLAPTSKDIGMLYAIRCAEVAGIAP